MVETQPHFLREWRKHRELTLEQVAEIARDVHGHKTTYATIGRIERGLLPYSQPLLEVLAAIYGTTVPALLGSDPKAAGVKLFVEWAEDDLRELEQLEGEDRQQVVALAKRLAR